MPQPSPVARLPFRIQLEVPLQEDNPAFCWFVPRAVAIPGAGRDGRPAVLITLVKHLAADDHYSGTWTLRTDDLGRTWEGPTEIPELGWSFEPGEVTVAVFDATPGWHGPTGKVLAIAGEERYDSKGRLLRSRPRSIQTGYAVYDPHSRRWTPWRVLAVPQEPLFDYALSAAGQWLVEPDGTLLVPIYYQLPPGTPGSPSTPGRWGATVARCAFDGQTLAYLEHGSQITRDEREGHTEPSLVRFNGRYYLTLRAWTNGHVAVSDDGLHFSSPQPWRFDDGTDLGSVNTQQHWLVHSEGLFLCYTRKGANNDHIPRARAPLFIAQVDPERLCVIRATEQVLMPERGLMLGNFGAAAISPEESWVTDAEFVCYPLGLKPTPQGGNGSVFLARVQWSRPNGLVETPSPAGSRHR